MSVVIEGAVAAAFGTVALGSLALCGGAHIRSKLKNTPGKARRIPNLAKDAFPHKSKQYQVGFPKHHQRSGVAQVDDNGRSIQTDFEIDGEVLMIGSKAAVEMGGSEISHQQRVVTVIVPKREVTLTFDSEEEARIIVEKMRIASSKLPGAPFRIHKLSHDVCRLEKLLEEKRMLLTSKEKSHEMALAKLKSVQIKPRHEDLVSEDLQKLQKMKEILSNHKAMNHHQTSTTGMKNNSEYIGLRDEHSRLHSKLQDSNARVKALEAELNGSQDSSARVRALEAELNGSQKWELQHKMLLNEHSRLQNELQNERARVQALENELNNSSNAPWSGYAQQGAPPLGSTTSNSWHQTNHHPEGLLMSGPLQQDRLEGLEAEVRSLRRQAADALERADANANELGRAQSESRALRDEYKEQAQWHNAAIQDYAQRIQSCEADAREKASSYNKDLLAMATLTTENRLLKEQMTRSEAREENFSTRAPRLSEPPSVYSDRLPQGPAQPRGRELLTGRPVLGIDGSVGSGLTSAAQTPQRFGSDRVVRALPPHQYVPQSERFSSK